MLTSKALLLKLLLSHNLEIDTDHYDVEQLYCLSQNIYHEAGNQDMAGKIQVGSVTVTRVLDSRHPGTICGVVQEHSEKRLDIPYLPAINRCHFSWYCDGKSDIINVRDPLERDAYHDSMVAAILVASGYATGLYPDATHYYNPKLAAPKWAKYYTYLGMVGEHRFYRREEGSLF